MPETTKRVLFIGENEMMCVAYASNAKKSYKISTKEAIDYHKKRKKYGVSDEEITNFLVAAMYSNASHPAHMENLNGFISDFRDYNEYKCGLTADVTIVLVVTVGACITGMILPWNMDPAKFDDLRNQDHRAFCLMGLEALVDMLHDDEKLDIIHKMNECPTKREMMKWAKVFGWVA